MKKVIYLIILIGLITFSGCWDYREINEFSIALGLGIDKGEEKGYYISAELADIQGEGSEAELIPIVTTRHGETIFDGIQNMVTRSGQNLFWSHAMIVIVSHELAREGMTPIIDWILREGSVRSDIFVLVSLEDSAFDVMKIKSPIYNAISSHLAYTLNSHTFSPKFIPKKLWELKQELSEPGIAATLPTVRVVQDGDTKTTEIWGTAVFKKDKMIGWLDGTESFFFSMIRPVPVSGVLAQTITLEGTTGHITYELAQKKSRYIATIRDGKPHIEVEIKLEVGLADFEDVSPDIKKPEIRELLEHYLETYIHQEVLSLITKVQQEFKSDIFGFGATIHRKHPKIWRELESNWGEEFSKLDVLVTIDAVLTSSGLLSKSISLRD